MASVVVNQLRENADTIKLGLEHVLKELLTLRSEWKALTSAKEEAEQEIEMMQEIIKNKDVPECAVACYCLRDLNCMAKTLTQIREGQTKTGLSKGWFIFSGLWSSGPRGLLSEFKGQTIRLREHREKLTIILQVKVVNILNNPNRQSIKSILAAADILSVMAAATRQPVKFDVGSLNRHLRALNLSAMPEVPEYSSQLVQRTADVLSNEIGSRHSKSMQNLFMLWIVLVGVLLELERQMREKTFPPLAAFKESVQQGLDILPEANVTGVTAQKIVTVLNRIVALTTEEEFHGAAELHAHALELVLRGVHNDLDQMQQVAPI